jgi:hypothetical protein
MSKAKVSGVDDKKRDTERIELLGGLNGEVMVFQQMLIRQISKGGMQVETGFPLPLDSLHDFRLTLGDRSVVVKGRIAHSRISDVDQEVVVYRSGIEFIEPSTPVAAVISEFIETLRGTQITEISPIDSD